MKTLVPTMLAALMLVSAPVATPASAQTLSTMLPTLTWPDDTITPSTKGCVPEESRTACDLSK